MGDFCGLKLTSTRYKKFVINRRFELNIRLRGLNCRHVKSGVDLHDSFQY